MATSTTASTETRTPVYRSLVPARMDRLPWARFHWLVVVALGITWILDGLEVQIASLIGPVLQHRDTLHLSSSQVGLTATVYLLGEVIGALVFGRLSDKLGRRKLFIFTLGLYLVANALTGFSLTLVMFLGFRFFAGMGIGGEYAAINSAIDELIPAEYRGRVDIAINGTYWAGAALGAAAEIVLLNPSLIPRDLGWRMGLFIGPVIGVAIWRLRRHIPESPRWLMTHGHAQEADDTVTMIEEQVRASGKHLPPVDESKAIEVKPRDAASYYEIARVMLRDFRSRSILGFTMMVTQSFLYNAIFFTYALVLKHFYGIADNHTAYFFFPFAIGNLLGPLTIGHLFDTVGRRRMISSTYCVSAVLLAFSGWLFQLGVLNAYTQTILWCVIFFLASAAASSAYLTVSEIFPLELRSQAISFFFAISQFCGGVFAPWLFGKLIGDGKQTTPLFIGYLLGAALMFTGGLVAWYLGVDAERKSLEDIASPLAAVRKAATTVRSKVEERTLPPAAGTGPTAA
jgi:MFS family permease